MRTRTLAAIAFAAATFFIPAAVSAATVFAGGGASVVGSPPVPPAAPLLIEASFNAGDDLSFGGGFMSPTTESVTFKFTLNDGQPPVTMKGLAFTAVGGDTSEFSNIVVSISNGATGDTSIVNIVPTSPPAGIGGGGYEHFGMIAGAANSVSLTFTNTGVITETITFSMTVTSAIPVPAGLPLLATALGASVLLRSRKKAAAAV